MVEESRRYDWSLFTILIACVDLGTFGSENSELEKSVYMIIR